MCHEQAVPSVLFSRSLPPTQLARSLCVSLPCQGHRPDVQLIEHTRFPDRHCLVCLSPIEMLLLQTIESARNNVKLRVAVQKAIGARQAFVMMFAAGMSQNRHAPCLIWPLCDSRFSASCRPKMVSGDLRASGAVNCRSLLTRANTQGNGLSCCQGPRKLYLKKRTTIAIHICFL